MLTLKIGSRLTVKVADLTEASERYSEARDASGEGASTFREGRVFDGNKVVARISYNGRIWADKEWSPGDRPIA